ncbi:MAG: ribosome biosis GTPase / thiamine phosphate phosphatase [Micromonosporaceae bacterium]
MTFDLVSLGWDADFAAAYAPLARPDQYPARVARVDRGICTVLAAAGTGRASLGGALLARAGRDPIELPCTGDWVAVREWPDERHTIEAVLPRRTQVVRADASEQSFGQALAANVDVAAVVEPMDPTPEPGRVERLLALAWESGARPLVVLTKADRVADPATVAAQIADVAPGVEVVAVSARTGRGLSALVPLVARGRTLGLLGPSGAGKSTLVNALAGATVMTTQASRRSDGRGRHTTTHRTLIPLPGGGAVLDTPGIRAVGLHDSASGLDLVFVDIERLAAECRFADCGHDGEPGCAIRAALDAGALPVRRYENWRRLHRELAWQQRRRDVRLAAEAKAEWKRRWGRRPRLAPLSERGSAGSLGKSPG